MIDCKSYPSSGCGSGCTCWQFQALQVRSTAMDKGQALTVSFNGKKIYGACHTVGQNQSTSLVALLKGNSLIPLNLTRSTPPGIETILRPLIISRHFTRPHKATQGHIRAHRARPQIGPTLLSITKSAYQIIGQNKYANPRWGVGVGD